MLGHVIADRAARTASAHTASSAIPTRTELSLIGDPVELGRCHEILGILSATVGQYAESLKHLNTALAIFERQGLLTALAQVYGNIGAVYAIKAENAVAHTYLHPSLQLPYRIRHLPTL